MNYAWEWNIELVGELDGILMIYVLEWNIE